MRPLLELFADGGPWMYPVAAAGAVGIALAVVNALSRKDRTTWTILALVLCLLLGMLAAAFRMGSVLDYIAAGPGGRKFWMPLTLAAVGMLPPYLAALLAAAGSSLLGLARACRCRGQRRLGALRLIDGLIAASILIDVAVVTHAVPDMLISAMAASDKHTAMALGLAGGVRRLLWPTLVALVLLAVRAALAAGQRHEIPEPLPRFPADS